MVSLVTFIHILVCISLILIILVQSGKGGGLAGAFGGSSETFFGTRAGSFLTKATSFLAVLFVLTCISLAILSIRRSSVARRAAEAMTEAPAPAPESEKP